MAFNGLSDEQAERLALLQEECGEVIQAVAKILRHGYESTHPESGETNTEALERELGDLRAALALMFVSGDVMRDAVQRRAQVKLRNVGRYLHHQALSTLEHAQRTEG